MVYANIDSITKRTLLEKGMPFHYYLEYLLHISAGVRELTKDTLRVINAANLPVNSYGAIDSPGDFDDDVALCVPAGEYLQEIPKSNSINPLRLHSPTTGQFVPYTDVNASENSIFFGFPMVWSWYWNFSDYGEPTGRFFGAPGGARNNYYSVFKERGQIQVTTAFTSPNAILLYISNGQSLSDVSQIDWKAFRCLQTYCDWQSSDNRSNKDSPEGRTFYNEKRLLRSALNPLTKTDIINIYRNSYRATEKS